MPYLRLSPESELHPSFVEWILWLGGRERKTPHTVRAYSQGLRRIIHFSEMPATDFRPDFLNQASLTDVVLNMLNAQHDGLISESTIEHSLAALKSYYDFCQQDGILKEAPSISRVRKVAKIYPPQADPIFYRPNEIRVLYQEAGNPDPAAHAGPGIRWCERDLAMCSYLAILGLRSAELIAADVNWIQVERTGDTGAKVEGAVMHVTGKRGKIRHLPLSPELFAAKEAWNRAREERFGQTDSESPLFVTLQGHRFTYRQLSYWLTSLNRGAGLRQRSLHSLRHTAGVQLAAAHVPMNVIQGILGHANVKTAGIYTELAAQDLVGVLSRSEANGLLRKALEDTA